MCPTCSWDANATGNTSGVRGALAVRADDGGFPETPSDFHCEVADIIVTQVLSNLCKSRARDNRQAVRRIVSEIYSLPRVTAEIVRSRNRHLLPGFAMDITTNDPEDGRPWDFSSKKTREKARMALRRQKPYLFIGSPVCTAFCTWQALNYARSSDKAAMDRRQGHRAHGVRS